MNNQSIMILSLLLFCGTASATTFSTDATESISICPLDNYTIVTAWADETNDDRTFAIYDTNGTLKVGPIDADTVAGTSAYISTSVAAFNSTHFVVAWFDSDEFDITFSIYNSDGTLKAGPIDVDTAVGYSYAVSVSAFNSTHFVIGWFDNDVQSTSFRIYDSSGSPVTGIINADTASGLESYAVSVSAFNSTHFVIGWYDNIDHDASFRIYDSSGSPVTGIIDADTSVDLSQSVSVSAFNSTHFVFAWYSADIVDDITFSIYDSSGTLISGPIDADDSVSSSRSVSVSAIDQTNFVIGWYDAADGDASFRLYDSSGTPYTAIIDYNTTSLNYQDVASYEAATNIKIYNNNFVMGHAYSATLAQWAAYDGSDGSSWDGSLPTYACSYDICVDATGWWQDGGALNSTATPIQHAIDNTSSYDTVYIYNGSYTENIDISTTHRTIKGEGRDVVTITAASSADDTFHVTGDYTNLTGLTVTGATDALKSGIYVRAEHCNISTNNVSGNYYGIFLSGFSCQNNIVDNNTANSNHDGIRLDSSSNNNITSNTANSNTVNGIMLWYATNNNITDNNASSNYNRGLYIYDESDNNAVNNNTFLNNTHGIQITKYCEHNKLTNNNASNNDYGISMYRAANNNTFTSNTANSNTIDGVHLQYLNKHNIFDRQISSNNVEYDYFSWSSSSNNTLLNCNLSDASSMMNDSTSQWIIKYTDGRIIDTDDPALTMVCYADNCTLTLEPTAANYTLNMTTLDVTVSAATGSVAVSANSTLVSIDYENTTINDLNITTLDRQLILESAGVQTMVFNPTNIFNLWDFEYYINATANRKAVAFNTYCTNATNLINFTFYDLYPSSTFDCKYNSISFVTNTSGTTGTLEFNKSIWTANVTRAVEIYMTTTPYRCDGVCAVSEGTPMMLYLDLNDTTITNVRAEITKPNGEKANNSMTDFLDNGDTSWYLNYADTGNAGTYSVNNFYSSKDGLAWKQLDSFLSFESRSTSGGGGGGSVPDDGADDGEGEVPDGNGAGGGAQPEPTPEPAEEEQEIKPDKQFTADLTDGQATFNGSIVTRVVTNQSGTTQIDEFKINPTTTSLIGGTRYGYADISVPDCNIGGTVCFAAPTTDTSVSIYHLEDNEWVELKTTNGGAEICADTGHFSYFALADEAMESVIESMTQLSFDYPKVDGIMFWKWLSDVYTTTHIANRELTNVSASEGVICEILTTGDYPNRTLMCTYTPPKDAEWSSLKYQGEVIAVDTEGYTRRIPVKLSIYNMGKLGFPILAGLIVFGGFILYRYPPKRTW